VVSWIPPMVQSYTTTTKPPGRMSGPSGSNRFGSLRTGTVQYSRPADTHTRMRRSRIVPWKIDNLVVMAWGSLTGIISVRLLRSCVRERPFLNQRGWCMQRAAPRPTPRELRTRGLELELF
jgi:hypothetical protein